MTADHLWIPYTKLRSPTLRADLVLRKRVDDLLRTSIQTKPLTLISAPAGYGKTTLVSHVLAQPQNILEAYDVAWLSLDDGDDDPALFMAGLVAALKQVDPALGLSIEAVQRGQIASRLTLQQQMGLLINDIGQVTRKTLILVLDDLHTIQSSDIHQALDYLVQRMPSQMRIVITTRIDPLLGLARLRGRGELTEIRPPDLRFTMEEAAALFNDAFGLHLQENELRTLHTNVEGWAAGLRLVAASLSQVQTNDRAEKINRLAKVNLPLFDLLAEEVLSQQPPAIQEFLLATSVLEELTPDLCRAVMEDRLAPQLLGEAYRRNLFLVAKEEALELTYQYHDLFANFLRHHLTQANPAQMQIFHRRAGDAESNGMRAIRHYLAAEAYEQAGQRIEQVAEQMFEQGLFARLYEWIAALPEDVLHVHPWLSFYMGMVHWWQSQYAAAQQVLEKALAAFEARNDQRGCGEAMVQLSIVHQTQGDFAPAIAYIHSALDRPISPRSRCQSFMALAWLSLAQGQLELAANQLDTALTLAETDGDEGAVNICMIQTRFVFECVPGGGHFISSPDPSP